MKDALQEQLAAARRTQILDAATKVFAAKGFHPTTIKDVAREAGIADGTIYIYFANKTALLFGILDRMIEVARSDADFSHFSAADFRSFLRAYLRPPLLVPKADDFALFRVVISEILVNREMREMYYHKILVPTLAMTETFFQQWADAHNITPGDMRLTLRAISGMVLGLIIERIMGDTTLETQWDELPDFLADMLLNGIGRDRS